MLLKWSNARWSRQCCQCCQIYAIIVIWSTNDEHVAVKTTKLFANYSCNAVLCITRAEMCSQNKVLTIWACSWNAGTLRHLTAYTPTQTAASSSTQLAQNSAASTTLNSSDSSTFVSMLSLPADSSADFKTAKPTVSTAAHHRPSDTRTRQTTLMRYFFVNLLIGSLSRSSALSMLAAAVLRNSCIWFSSTRLLFCSNTSFSTHCSDLRA